MDNKNNVNQNEQVNKIKTKRVYSSPRVIEEDEIPEAENFLKKMLSFFGSLFFNVSGITILIISLVAGVVIFTGFDVIPIMEQVFIVDSELNISSSQIEKVKGLDLTKDVVSELEFASILDKVNNEMNDILTQRSIFDEGRQAFNNKMRVFYSNEYSALVETEDVLYEALKDIYSIEYRYPYSTTVTSVGKVIKDGQPVTKAIIDINGVDDDLGFHVWSLALFFNKKQEVESIKVLSEDLDLKNTRTPLDTENSLIKDTVNTFMSKEVSAFMKEFNNKGLYEKSKLNTSEINESQQKAFFSKLSLEQKSYDVLGELFNTIQGDTSNLSVIEYINTDLGGISLTNIILGVKISGEVVKYNLEFNRDEQVLVNISKI